MATKMDSNLNNVMLIKKGFYIYLALSCMPIFVRLCAILQAIRNDSCWFCAQLFMYPH